MCIRDRLAHSPTIKIHVLSGQSDDVNVKRALSLGAVDFIAKPCDVDKLKDMLLNALKVQDVELNEIKAEQEHDGLLGNSLPMQALRMQITQFADSPFPVLIEGESGSGKELVAGSFHHASKRKLHPYLSVNCAAISPLLAESILFGHTKGAFTGAISAVSYTHLDVYKRQVYNKINQCLRQLFCQVRHFRMVISRQHS